MTLIWSPITVENPNWGVDNLIYPGADDYSIPPTESEVVARAGINQIIGMINFHGGSVSYIDTDTPLTLGFWNSLYTACDTINPYFAWTVWPIDITTPLSNLHLYELRKSIAMVGTVPPAVNLTLTYSGDMAFQPLNPLLPLIYAPASPVTLTKYASVYYYADAYWKFALWWVQGDATHFDYWYLQIYYDTTARTFIYAKKFFGDTPEGDYGITVQTGYYAGYVNDASDFHIETV